MPRMHTASTPPPQASGSKPGAGSTSYPPLPASPTLTNPDMILPDYDDTFSSPDRSQSPLTMWKNSHIAQMGFDLTPQAFTGPVTPTTPITPIIYGNGTMLSDIGEVTEVESTCPDKPRRRLPRNDGSTQQASMGLHETLQKKDSKINRERRLSMESTSTITISDHPAPFADFDDAVSVDDSVFQGDDEESVADSFFDEAYAKKYAAPVRTRTKSQEDRYSNELSRRAEEILANAKRRLTTMEGNLSRARTSLYSPTSDGSGSTPSPPIARPTTAIQRGQHESNNRQSTHGHTRISSESNIPTLPPDIMKPGMFIPRSSSALGAAGGYRPPLHSPLGADAAHESAKNSSREGLLYSSSSFARSKTSLHVREHALEPLDEDNVSESVGSSRPSLENSRFDTFLSPTFGSYSEKGLKRSASTAQMRDLKDQMNDLKGRLSTLRDQARADSLKRRSLQSLRTPSPFTHARVDQWYVDGSKNEGSGSVTSESKSQLSNGIALSVNGGESNLVAKQMAVEVDERLVPNGHSYSEDETSVKSNDNEKIVHSIEGDNSSIPNSAEDDLDDMRTEDGYEQDDNEVELEDDEDFEAEELTESVIGSEESEEDVIDDGASESDASSYYDTLQNQLSHEDREDAFDYEHFFLHSAMGSMSRKKRSDSQGSFSSEDSVETTRGPAASANARPARSRRASVGSVSSVESFATATEGRSTRAENEAAEVYLEHGVIVPKRSWAHTPDMARRSGFSTAETSDSGSDKSRFQPANIRRPQSSAAAFMHRPSVSSFDSSKTHRSFPLVNKPKINGGILTPRDSPDRDLSQISESLMDETFHSAQSDDSKAVSIDMLQKDDRILVDRLVASLGQCVLGLGESGRGSPDYRAYRRKIEAARRALESLDESM